MAYANKKKALLNVIIAFGAQIINLLFAILAKRFLISEIGNEANGLYQLFISITSMVSIVELGVGTSIIYCLYEPIATNNNVKVAALYHFFKKSYLIIGILVLAIGSCIIPFLPFIAGDYEYECNIYYCYFIVLLFTALPYSFSYKQHLINAYKNGYISSIIHGIALLVEYVSQIIVLVLFKSFELYLWAKVFSVFIEWIGTQIGVRKYGEIIGIKSKLDEATKSEVKKNIGAMFSHRIGYLVINTADSLMISFFAGIAILGFYSNYVSLSSALYNLLILFISPMTAILGHIYIEKGNKETSKYLEFFHSLNFVIGIIFYLGYYAVIDSCINMFYGLGLLLPRKVIKLMVISLFVRYLKQAIGTVRDATGAFYYDRWKPIVECIVNIGLNIALGMWLGISGIFLATIITTVCVSDVIEPLVINKKVLKLSPKLYYFKHSIFIIIFIALIYLFDYICMFELNSDIATFFTKGFISVGISLAVSLIVFLIDKNFRALFKDYLFYLLKKGKYSKNNTVANEEGD